MSIRCQICGREFGTLNGLSRHLRHTHKMDPTVYIRDVLKS